MFRVSGMRIGILAQPLSKFAQVGALLACPAQSGRASDLCLLRYNPLYTPNNFLCPKPDALFEKNSIFSLAPTFPPILSKSRAESGSLFIVVALFLVPKLSLGTPSAKLCFACSAHRHVERRETEFREDGSQTEFGNQGVSFLTLDSIKPESTGQPEVRCRFFSGCLPGIGSLC